MSVGGELDIFDSKYPHAERDVAASNSENGTSSTLAEAPIKRGCPRKMSICYVPE